MNGNKRFLEFLRSVYIRYEMKAPPAENEVGEAEGIRLGKTRFFYSLNELHTPAGTVIITARQAEILKLLAVKAQKMQRTT